MDLFDLLGINLKVTLVIIAAFTVFAVVLYHLLFKKIGKVLDDRQNLITSKFAEIEEKGIHVENLVKQYEQKIREIEKEALEKMQVAVKEGISKKEQILEQARKEAEQELAKVRAIIGIERDKLKQELKTDMSNLLITAINKILPDIMDEQIQKRILIKFENELKSNKELKESLLR
ncbi:MAG: ATP synthase F0 subunit B [Planctomycetes bacterium]|nr:ATP synthase F0 subunit B [Planctomycetota bacterium]